MRAVVVLALALALPAPAAAAVTQPAQPTSGPGGSDYAHAGWRIGSGGSGADAWYVFEPVRPRPSKAPLTIVMHGYYEFAGYATRCEHARYQRGELTEANLADALRAAAVVGSDFQQLSAGGTIRPETWTHGSSRQRQHWLTVGFEQGRPAACDTFGG